MLMGEWWKDYSSGKLRKDYDGNYGVQCVDTANSYAEHVLGFGKGVFYGVRYAKEIFNNHNKKLFKAVKNTPSGVPVKGSLIIWNRGTAGHIAIVEKATEHTITVFESNFDGKGSLRKHTYENYNNVVGWLIPYKMVNIDKGLTLLTYIHRGYLDSNIYGFCKNGELIYLSGTDTKNGYAQIRSSFDTDLYVNIKYLK